MEKDASPVSIAIILTGNRPPKVFLKKLTLNVR